MTSSNERRRERYAERKAESPTVHSDRSKKRYVATRDASLARSRASYEACKLKDPLYRKRRTIDPLKAIIWGAKYRAKKRGIEFNLRVEDFKIPDVCPVLGIPLMSGAGKGHVRPTEFTPSLDRIDNTKGYVKGNVVIVSWRANRLKSDATADELQKIAVYIERRAA